MRPSASLPDSQRVPATGSRSGCPAEFFVGASASDYMGATLPHAPKESAAVLVFNERAALLAPGCRPTERTLLAWLDALVAAKTLPADLAESYRENAEAFECSFVGDVPRLSARFYGLRIEVVACDRAAAAEHLRKLAADIADGDATGWTNSNLDGSSVAEPFLPTPRKPFAL